MKKFYVLILLSFVLLLLIGYYFVNIESSSNIAQKEHEVMEEEVIRDQSNEEATPKSKALTTEIKQLIKDQHKFFNESAGWGGIDSIKWNEQKNHAKALIEDLSKTEISTTLEADFARITELASIISNGKKDKTVILYLHRLFHDLDVEINDYRSKDYFEVTEIGEGKKVEAVRKVIEKNK